MSIEGFQRMDEVAERPVEWLWEDRIPIGEITNFEGDPGANKSSVMCDVVARISRGDSMPDAPPHRERPRQGGALLMIGEDSVSKTVKRRLRAAGADLNKIAVIEGVGIPGDLGRIEGAIREIGAKIVVVDTLNDFLDCNVLGNQAVRRALRPLRTIAEEAHVAVVLLRHFVKRGGGHSLHRGGGSVAITAMARSQLKVYKHPTDPNMRVLIPDKCNLGPLAPSLLVEIVPADENQFRLEWRGECSFTVEELERTHRGSKLEAAEKFLLDTLSDGPKEVNRVVEQSEGICSKRTLDEAKKNLRLATLRKGKGHGHKVFWALKPLQLPADGDLQGVEVRKLPRRDDDTDALLAAGS